MARIEFDRNVDGWEINRLYHVVDGSETVSVAAGLVRSEPDEQWLIWCRTVADYAACRDALPDVTTDVISGSTHLEDRTRIIADFDSGRTRVLISNIYVLGTGIRSQTCARIILINPSSEEYPARVQAENRCCGPGQGRAVVVHIVTSDVDLASLDESERLRARRILERYT